MMHHSFGRTAGPALITILGLGGFIALFWQGKIHTTSDIWLYVSALAMTVVFYMALLFCRALFHFMAGNEEIWWQKYEEESKKSRK